MSVEQFIDDDAGYLRWLQANPHGFIVNSDRSPRAGYLKLHKASCSFLTPANASSWTKDYIKTCSHEIEPLSRWSREVVGGDLQPCGACKPGSPGGSRPTAPRPVAATAPSPRQTAPIAPPPIPSAISANSVGGQRQLPATISTGCPELDLVWSRFAQEIVRSPILIADSEDDLNWHAFLGHSIDMQGFRAAEFVGVDALTKAAPGFVPLKTREIGIPELAGLWEIEPIRSFLHDRTKEQFLASTAQKQPFPVTLEVLKRFGGRIGTSLAEAFDAFPFRKKHSTVRAYLENSAALKEHGYSFRNWLKAECAKLGVAEFPPADFRSATRMSISLEITLRRHLEKAFYQVGPALAAYMICDWQLWLWWHGRTSVFANFKLDSFHEEFVKKFGRGVIPTDEPGFARWWLSLYPDLPPRLANECIWLGIEEGVV